MDSAKSCDAFSTINGVCFLRNGGSDIVVANLVSLSLSLSLRVLCVGMILGCCLGCRVGDFLLAIFFRLLAVYPVCRRRFHCSQNLLRQSPLWFSRLLCHSGLANPSHPHALCNDPSTSLVYTHKHTHQYTSILPPQGVAPLVIIIHSFIHSHVGIHSPQYLTAHSPEYRTD